MRFKHILAMLAAAASMLTGCNDEFEISTLDGFDCSATYFTLPSAASSTSVSFVADQSWTVQLEGDFAKWASVSPESGAAGSSSITLSAIENTSAKRSGDVKIVLADGRVQILTLAQDGGEPGPSSCAEVLNGEDGKTYKVTGTITSIVNTHYGNWYINDGTGEVYVYGTCDKKGNTNTSSTSYDNLNDPSFNDAWELSVGDVVTITGPRKDYSGTIEMVDVTIISIVKSLMTIVDESYSFPRQGGTAEVKVAYKGNGLSVVPQADWISLGDINVTKDTTFVTLKIAENTGDPRTGTVDFETSIPGQTTKKSVTISEAGVSGTLATPFSVAQAIEFCKTLSDQEITADQFYIKGKVSRIANNGAFGAQYGNGTFWISDDGVFHGTDDKNADKAVDFEVYRGLWLGNQKWVDGNYQLQVGDEVIICGNVTLYGGLAETASGKAYIYSINGVSDNMTGEGTAEKPFNVPAAISVCNKLKANSTEDYYVEGIVSKVVEAFSGQFGNGTFWLSVDGQYNNDLMKDFEAYRVIWKDNQKWADGDDQVAVGDKVVLCGTLAYYKGTSETSQGKAYVYSHIPAN